MALTITSLNIRPVSNSYAVTGQVAFDSSYPTGGESLTARDIGLRTIDFIVFEQRSGVVFDYDYTNAKVLARVQGVQVGAAGSVTMDDFPLAGVAADTAISVSLTNTGGTATHRLGVLKEVGSTADLSTITGVRFLAFGA
jgi:hypothetical protein